MLFGFALQFAAFHVARTPPRSVCPGTPDPDARRVAPSIPANGAEQSFALGGALALAQWI
jgi:hypothetical protein